jgi:hypothetical protein
VADDVIQLYPDGAGKKLDAEKLTVGANDVYRERHQITGTDADDKAVVTDSDPIPGTDHALAVKILDPINPVSDYKTSANLGALASVNLDGSAIAAGATGKLKRVIVSSSVPCKWTIKARDGASETILGVIRTGGYAEKPNEVFEPPDKYYNTLAYGDGDENFRVTCLNQWTLAADVDATIFWDEVS